MMAKTSLEYGVNQVTESGLISDFRKCALFGVASKLRSNQARDLIFIAVIVLYQLTMSTKFSWPWPRGQGHREGQSLTFRTRITKNVLVPITWNLKSRCLNMCTIYPSKNIMTTQTTCDVKRPLPVGHYLEIQHKKGHFSGKMIGCRRLSQ